VRWRRFTTSLSFFRSTCMRYSERENKSALQNWDRHLATARHVGWGQPHSRNRNRPAPPWPVCGADAAGRPGGGIRQRPFLQACDGQTSRIAIFSVADGRAYDRHYRSLAALALATARRAPRGSVGEPVDVGDQLRAVTRTRRTVVTKWHLATANFFPPRY
jgi:hypothetical protein